MELVSEPKKGSQEGKLVTAESDQGPRRAAHQLSPETARDPDITTSEPQEVPPAEDALPWDHPSCVFRDPSEFGGVIVNRHPQFLIADKRQYMKECLHSDSKRRGKRGAAGTNRPDFADKTKLDMLRCPMGSCGYRVINSRNIPQSLPQYGCGLHVSLCGA